MRKYFKSRIGAFIVLALVVAAAVAVFTGCETILPNASSLPPDSVRVHFLDVGQADCEFIELPNGQTMLIDAGDNGTENDVIGYISALGYDAIDYVVATHPHADHIGGMAEVLDRFEIGKIYMPRKSHTSKTFEDMLTVIQNKNISLNAAETGVSILSDGDLNISILSPSDVSGSDLNNVSAVVKLDYGKSSFLFMGDAEAEIESGLLNQDIDSDILKVGHHGSKTSSSDAFIAAVSPIHAVISCGVDNDYGHPAEETLETLDKYGVTVHRTDLDGTIVVTGDKGGDYTID